MPLPEDPNVGPSIDPIDDPNVDPNVDPERQEPELESEPEAAVDLDFDEDQWDGDEPQANPDDWSIGSLRAKQLANYETQLAKGRDPGPQIGYVPDPDADPADAKRVMKAETGRRYDQLRRTFFPLILEDPRNAAAQATGRPQTPWTLDEIVNAMAPIVGKFAYSYGKGQPGYQPDDAKSDGNQAIIIALQKDGGLSPFGRYAAKMAYRAIYAGSKGASALPIPIRSQTHSPRYISSYNKEVGDTGKTGAATIPTTTNVASRGEKCPACGGAKDEKGKPVPCGVCDQRGFLVVSQPRSGTKTPATEIIDKEQQDVKRNALQDMIPRAELTERQVEVLLLRFGLEGLLSPDIENTGDEKKETAIGRILGAADMIYKDVVSNQGRGERSGYWAEAEAQGRTDEFQQIWDKAFGDMAHEPFNPKIPASLQISVLYQMAQDRPRTEKELKSKVWPPPHIPQKKLGRLYELMLDLYKAFGPGDDISDEAGAGRPAWKGGGPPIGVWRPNSKMSVQIKLAAAKNRMDKVVESGDIPPEYMPGKIIPGATGRVDYGKQYQNPNESVHIVLNWLFEAMLESIECGEIASIEDIDRYEQAITT